jgi:hypothetical protein
MSPETVARINITHELAAQLAARGQENVTQAGREALERYIELLHIGRAALRDRKLSAGDLTALCAVSASTAWGAHDLGPVRPDGNSIAISVADEEPALVAEHTDRDALLAKLRKLSTVEVAALIDALERFWRASGTGMAVDPARILD